MSLDLLSTGYNGRLTSRATDFFGNPIGNPDAEFVYASDTRQSIGLSWQLRGPSPWNRLQRIGADNDGRRTAEQVAAEELRLSVERSYFDAL